MQPGNMLHVESQPLLPGEVGLELDRLQAEVANVLEPEGCYADLCLPCHVPFVHQPFAFIPERDLCGVDSSQIEGDEEIGARLDLHLAHLRARDI